eukprot:Polyplicarium_translucidae@DN1650_c0_g1_i7.p2
MRGIGVPVKLLYEGLGHTVTIEIQTGEVYRGFLTNAADNMNCMMEGVTMTTRDGKLHNLEQIYIRGAQIRFAIFPDMLKHAPMFKLVRSKGKPSGGVGVGGQRRAMAMRARASTAMSTARRGGPRRPN